MALIVFSNIGAKMVAATSQEVALVADFLSYDVDTASFRAGVGIGRYNSKRSFLTMPDMIFPAGFVPLVERALVEHKFDVAVQDLRTHLETLGPNFELNGIELFDYQLEACEAAITNKRGVIRIATGGGKTETAAAVVKKIGRKTLFIMHKVDLVQQTAQRFHNRLGVNCGIISEGEFNPDQITIASVQTIHANWTKFWRCKGTKWKRDDKGAVFIESTTGRPVMMPTEIVVRGLCERDAQNEAMKEGMTVEEIILIEDRTEKVSEFLESIEVLLIDEAHRVSGDTFWKIVNRCKSAYYRFALTATPLMKGNREDDLRLIACTGCIIVNIPAEALIQKGVNAQPLFRFCEMPPFGFNQRLEKRNVKAEGNTSKAAMFQKAYDQGIVNNQTRNLAILEETLATIVEGRKPLVLVVRENHGRMLDGIFKAHGVSSFFLYGKHSPDERFEVLGKLRDGKIEVVIASTIFDEGIDADFVSAVVLAGGMKSKISLHQRVGRGSRKKKGEVLDKIGNTCKIVDFIDRGEQTLMKHSAQRFKTVREESGWVISSVVLWADRDKDEYLALARDRIAKARAAFEQSATPPAKPARKARSEAR